MRWSAVDLSLVSLSFLTYFSSVRFSLVRFDCAWCDFGSVQGQLGRTAIRFGSLPSKFTFACSPLLALLCPGNIGVAARCFFFILLFRKFIFFLFLPQLLFALRFEVLPQMVWQQQTRRTTAATAATTTTPTEQQQQQQISTTRVARDFD